MIRSVARVSSLDPSLDPSAGLAFAEAAPPSESPLARWSRRGLTWTLLPLALSLLSLLAPVLGSCAFLLDLLTPRKGHLRALLVIWVVLAAETWGLAAGGWIWLTTTRASAAGAARYAERNRALQSAWTAALFAALARILPLRLEVRGAEVLASPGPLVVLARHSSLVDTLLPALLIGCGARRLRYVLKRELLWDPCLDLVGQRLPNAFVARDGEQRESEVAKVRALGRGLGPGDAVLIYPEGTRFSPAALERARRWAHANGGPEAQEVAAACRHVLPPRLSGTRALLDVAQQADVVLLAHTGLEGLRGPGDILRLPRDGVRLVVQLERIPAEIVPKGPGQSAWLRALWLRLDEWVAEHRQAG